MERGILKHDSNKKSETLLDGADTVIAKVAKEVVDDLDLKRLPMAPNGQNLPSQPSMQLLFLC